MQQADAPRMVKLQALKKAEVKVQKPKRQSWKKKCPKCANQVHVRREECECGFKFSGG